MLEYVIYAEIFSVSLKMNGLTRLLLSTTMLRKTVKK